MNILIFSWRDMKHPQAGGAELYFHEFAKHWIKEGHKITWIGGGWKGCRKFERYDGINFIRAGKSQLSLYFLAPIEYLKLKEKPDVIIDAENGLPFFTPLFSRKKKILHVHHVHKDVWFQGDVGKLIGLLGYIAEIKVMPLIYRNTKIITVSNSSADELVREKLTRFKSFIVNPGIEFFKAKKFAKSGKPSILFLNRIKKYKGMDILLEAVNELNKKGINNFDVWVAGSGDYSEKAREYSKKMNLNNVQFLGRVSDEKKLELMQKAWVFVNPSFKEGWGIANVEANYFGTPVIGADVGGTKDSVVNGKTGFLFECNNPKALAEKIKMIIKDKKTTLKMGKDCKAWAQNFSWERKAKEYLDILLSIVHK